MHKRNIDSRTLLPPESESVEWKKSLGEWKEIVETCAAFASAKGGSLYVGVAPDGKATGISVGGGTLEDLANRIAQNTNPRQTPAISTVSAGLATLIVVGVSESPVKPVYAFDRPYRRCGRTNQRLSMEEAMHLFMSSRAITWDHTPLDDASMDDIDPAVVQRFLRVAQTERRWEINGDTPTEPVLRQLGLLRDGRLTVAAILLFGRRPQQFLTQAVVRCGRFKGTEAVHFLDMDAVQGTVIEQVERAMAFVKRNIRMGVQIRDVQRDDVWEYPLEGVREALVNAVCHRDYASAANVQIRIFDDRLEIWNPGGLPEGMTVADLWRQHESNPRNRLLAQAFFLIKYVEQFGTGIQRILDDCHAHRNPEPEFEAKGQTFRVVFRPAAARPWTGTDAHMNERQSRAVAFVREHGRITRQEYEDLTQTPSRTAKRDLANLAGWGVLRKCGAGRRVWYEVVGQSIGPQMARNGPQHGPVAPKPHEAAGKKASKTRKKQP